ncbi:hypothetical protein SDC9_52467 [bioreactor metagenome]|uniref:Low-affinity inorganic phosphate transporter 1 n=1 Tax=bioreactor metagenome TaxID=1076179 RepID=A0A644WRN3_9ZZZZ
MDWGCGFLSVFFFFVLMLGVMAVNGLTDAPNAIATAVATGALPFRRAACLAAFCEFFGVVVMTSLAPQVAHTLFSLSDFGSDRETALIALTAALCAVILWACAAWLFGIPTSESHALAAGVSGAAVALRGNFSALNAEAWLKVFLGLILSTLMGYLAGRFFARLLRFLTKGEAGSRSFFLAQIVGAAVMAFAHGAQDGQKFMGILLLGFALASGEHEPAVFYVPVWIMLICAAAISLGTFSGGRRIVETVGSRMTTLGPRQGLASDLAGGACLLLASLFGLPVSTTHTKTSAIFGVGMAETPGKVNGFVVKSIFLTWLLTFPGCALLGYGLTALFLSVFR